MKHLEAQVAAIEAMSARDRKTEWHRRTGTVAPPAFGSGLLARALAHAAQERALGGLGKIDLRRIAQAAASGQNSTVADGLKVGTWLSRTWHGEVHQVVVLDTGFEYNGQRFNSLSEIAKRITGAHWSGPRFFGLKSPRMGMLGVSTNGR
ncbi:DUF2924 domain-containing protein [Novosphingobium flavum]|uniref:DUF2924 domain-containing protein n=1 Tax=Novosphingobium flavum TaxID=1778672 RepID=A0A7X1KN25_9SPHN|nr:DUF2924 domain-containing protein [Novosphingobium flavum]